jgi:nodulation protein E
LRKDGGRTLERIAVTGIGCVSSLGLGISNTWQNLISGKSSAGPKTFTVDGPAQLSTSCVVAQVTTDLVGALTERFGRKRIIAVDRVANLAALATTEALDNAKLTFGSSDLEEAAIIFGCCSGGLVSIESAYERMFALGHTHPHPLTVPRLMVSAPVSHLSMLFGVRGLCLSIGSACASSAHAIAEGMHFIRAGRAKIVIVGGSDGSLTYGGMQSWRALNATSEVACRPFSANRDGTILGEGAASLVLESENSARARNAEIHCFLVGSGATADAAHMTQPSSASAARAVRAAHLDAGLPIDVPLLISAHGTGTSLNDQSEAETLRTVYGENLSSSRVIATKSSHGHMLGAAGAMELIVAILALQRRQAPPILNFLGNDPDCNLPLVLQPETIEYRAAISTSFGFGGLNAALIVNLP